MTITCSRCGKEMKRMRYYPNPVCFDCRQESRRIASLTYRNSNPLVKKIKRFARAVEKLLSVKTILKRPQIIPNERRFIVVHDMYESGKTMHEIGDSLTPKITRQRVQQILVQCPDFDELRRNRKKEKPSYFCLFCGKPIQSVQLKKYCNHGCLVAHRTEKLLSMTEKTCIRCHRTKPVSGFYPRNRKNENPNLLTSHCKTCFSGMNESWRKRNPEKTRMMRRMAGRKYYEKKRIMRLIEKHERGRNKI